MGIIRWAIKVEGVENPAHPKRRGQQSEAAVIYELVRRGITVLEPFGDNERYDIVVEYDSKFFRVQIKTGRVANGCVRFETRSSGTLTRKIKKEGYEGQVDLFAVHTPEVERTFIIPISKAPKTSMSLRIEKAEKSSPNINRAEEYSLNSWISSLRSDNKESK
ncbi:group I intron-associated PD-(D/E)XK endonuclease [Halorientalis salina]|uniref:group I intron-associated PD-(D/E)XK endonuclease n=1 Tax=Halorientalis salina TaxID=2932266 RepID=UPI0010AD5F87|nr:group I intron-associated PD-(D/E)XK endonuclease [Halorientalis salina]